MGKNWSRKGATGNFPASVGFETKLLMKAPKTTSPLLIKNERSLMFGPYVPYVCLLCFWGFFSIPKVAGSIPTVVRQTFQLPGADAYSE
jgi:hypothetical protein